jgi:hypothetical protein
VVAPLKRTNHVVASVLLLEFAAPVISLDFGSHPADLVAVEL